MEEAAEERVLDLPDPDETSLVGSGFAIWSPDAALDSACPTNSFKFVKEGHKPDALTLLNEFKCFSQL